MRFSAFGHDHRDMFEVTRSLSTNKPIGVNHIGGSLGTYMKVNPSVKIYTMHSTFHLPINYKVLEFNIEEANNGKPIFSEFVDMR